MLTKAALKKMEEVEEEFFTNEVYQDKFCLLPANSTDCKKPMSVLRYFDGTHKNLDPVFYDPYYDNINEVLSTADRHPGTRRSLRYCLGTGAVITATASIVNITRASLFIGLPLAGYANDSDRAAEQREKLKTFVEKTLSPIGDKYFDAGVGDMVFFYGNSITVVRGIRMTVFRDLRFLAVGYLFIFFYLWSQTCSFGIASLVMFTTATGFCGANLVYRVVLGYRYLGAFQVLSIFIMLGICADDVFVFNDTWRLSALEQHESLAHRLLACYRRTALAMFFTSLTTTVAFLVSAASPLLAVSYFGILSAMLVVMNYVSAVTFLPCAIVVHHLHWQRGCSCCRSCKQQFGERVRESPAQSVNFMFRFFRDTYLRMITHPQARWGILAGFTAFIGAAIYFATKVQINDEPVRLLLLELCPTLPAVTPLTLLELCIAFPAVTPQHCCDAMCTRRPIARLRTRRRYSPHVLSACVAGV